jgi:hypothetical protein
MAKKIVKVANDTYVNATTIVEMLESLTEIYGTQQIAYFWTTQGIKSAKS